MASDVEESIGPWAGTTAGRVALMGNDGTDEICNDGPDDPDSPGTGVEPENIRTEVDGMIAAEAADRPEMVLDGPEADAGCDMDAICDVKRVDVLVDDVESLAEGLGAGAGCTEVELAGWD